jgi:hypothetical protein
MVLRSNPSRVGFLLLAIIITLLLSYEERIRLYVYIGIHTLSTLNLAAATSRVSTCL